MDNNGIGDDILFAMDGEHFIEEARQRYKAIRSPVRCKCLQKEKRAAGDSRILGLDGKSW